MKRKMFFISLAQWCISMLAQEIDSDDDYTSCIQAYSALNVIRQCGTTSVIPEPKHCQTQLSPNKLAILQGWM